MRSLLFVLALLAIFAAPLAAAAQTGKPITLSGPASVVAAPNAPNAPKPTGVGLRVLKRQRMGLTVGGVCDVLRQLKAEGVLTDYVMVDSSGVKQVNCSALSVVVADRLAQAHPESWQDIDWDEVLAFLEKLLELILKYLPLILDLFM